MAPNSSSSGRAKTARRSPKRWTAIDAMGALIGILSIIIPVGLIIVVIAEPMAWPAGQDVFDVLRLVFGVAGILMMVGFIRHAVRSDAVPHEKRGLWVVVLLLGNILVLPFYWLWYIKQPQGSVRVAS
jgi:hypothetical protein